MHKLRSQLHKTHQPGGRTTIFLTCEPLQLSRLPWEVWEVGAEVGGQTPIAIVRTTANIRAESVPRPASRRGKPHMLVIWGEDPGLDMARDRTLLRSTRLCLTPQILAATALKPSPISSNVSVTPLLTPRGGEPPCSVCCPPVARRSPGDRPGAGG